MAPANSRLGGIGPWIKKQHQEITEDGGEASPSFCFEQEPIYQVQRPIIIFKTINKFVVES